ncbi:HupE/UreJ family protein [Friedmanniella luteola]|uniref:HupE/UreJ family protein n=1 Tax=Friedmanniella luteola TaxID=546871 RepID=UPI0018D488D5|nr:HupE/UreJ family protein [Friedmanniella luteola]
MLLDVGSHEVIGQVQLPIDRLAIAVDQPGLTTEIAVQPSKIEEFRRYVAEHTAATGTTDGEPWDVAVANGRVQTLDGVDHLVYDLTLRPPDGVVANFRLSYDAIVTRLVSHRVFVSARPASTQAYTAVGLIDWESQDLTVPAAGATADQGFLPAVRLGAHHITEGADHLLFVLMLLLPAPLLARRGRWERTENLRRSSWRVVHVVTAFAVGHSITLALAALGYVHAPTRVVESMIAVSILVAGLHAIKPIVRGGDTWIAAGFGLMHGLAFATLLGQLGLGRGSLVTELLGFNLGIELTQLLVVTLVMPSLMVLSRTSVYPAARTVQAGSGVLLAAAWLAERTTLLRTNPLAPLPDALVAHPLVVVASLALAATIAWAVPGWRVNRMAPADRPTAP